MYFHDTNFSLYGKKNCIYISEYAIKRLKIYFSILI